MLELSLSLQGRQVTVAVGGNESHQFSLLDLDLPQTKAQIKEFIRQPSATGLRLFQAIFKDDMVARRAFDDLAKQMDRTIVLVLESPELDSVPWEYAYHNEAYLVEDHPFLRALPETERPVNGQLQASYERMALLFISSNPLVDLNGESMQALDIEGEWKAVKEKIEASNAPFDICPLRPATPEALQNIMARFHSGLIVHYSGHGGLDDHGVAHLLFERENGASNPYPAREFIREVKDRASMIFLSACQSAVPQQTEFGNLARRLVKDGIPFALGMQFNLPDPFAPKISGQFYNYLGYGNSIPEAARQARRAVKREHEFFVGMIALYAAHPYRAIASKVGLK